MLHVIVLILKAIGMIFGVLLLILLLLLLTILFVPIRYKAEFEKNDETMKGVFTLSWLLHLLHGSITYHDTLKYSVRILGFKLIDSSRPKKKKRIKKNSKNQTGKKAKDLGNKTEDLKDSKELENKTKNIEEIKEAEDVIEDFKNEQNIQEEIANIEAKEPEKSKVKKRLQSVLSKVMGIFQKIKDMMNGIKEMALKINEGKLKLSKLKENLFTDINKRGYKKIWTSLKKIIRHIKPRKIRGFLIFGANDPYVTGQVFTYLGMFYAWIGKNLNFYANFNEEKLEGKIKVKGFMQMGYLLWVFVRLYFNRDCKEVLKTVQNMKEV